MNVMNTNNSLSTATELNVYAPDFYDFLYAEKAYTVEPVIYDPRVLRPPVVCDHISGYQQFLLYMEFELSEPFQK